MAYTPLSRVDSMPSLYLFLAGTPQHHGGLQDNPGFAFTQQLHTTAFLDIQAGTPPPHSRPQQLFLASEGDLTPPFLYPEPYGLTCQVLVLVGAGTWHHLSHFAIPACCFQWFPSLLTLSFTSFPQVGSLVGWGHAPRSPLPLFLLAGGFSLNFLFEPRT